MTFITRHLAVAIRPRPWLTREEGECAFPVGGDGARLRACCNPCGEATYCQPHAAAMRRRRTPSIAELEREILQLLEFLEYLEPDL